MGHTSKKESANTLQKRHLRLKHVVRRSAPEKHSQAAASQFFVWLDWFVDSN
jgi:hypothetical protein